MSQVSEEKKAPPAEKFTANNDGSRIEVSVWENWIKTDRGDKLTHGISFKRSYKTDEGWKSVTSMRRHDVPVLQYLLGKAYDYCMTKSEEG